MYSKPIDDFVKKCEAIRPHLRKFTLFFLLIRKENITQTVEPPFLHKSVELSADETVQIRGSPAVSLSHPVSSGIYLMAIFFFDTHDRRTNNRDFRREYGRWRI